MKRALLVLLLVGILLLALAAPALAFVHVRVPGDDCGGGPENQTAAAAITSQDRPGNMPPMGDDGGHDRAPDDFCPANG
jgi:hypothetical protein